MTEERRFQKKKEDFVCLQCGFHVIGNGYTNHCPQCLYSRHVDIMPGDRRETCGALMESIALEKENGTEKILQRCLKCGHERKNRVSPDDDFEALLALSKKSTDRSAGLP